MRNYTEYAKAVVMSGLPPAVALIGLVTVAIGGSIVAALLGWPVATVVASTAVFLLLVIATGGFRVSQAIAKERDEAVASTTDEGRIGVDNEGEMELEDFKTGPKLQTGLKNRSGGKFKGRRIDAD